MIDASSFIIRNSGKSGLYYIDYIGKYKVSEISSDFKIDLEKLNGIYRSNGGVRDPELDIYYFSSVDGAKKTITDIFSSLKKKDRGRSIIFTETEIEYIRKALINESGFAAINNKVKDNIFNKLNG